MSGQPVLCPACGAAMTCVSAFVHGVFKCRVCSFGTCLASEVAAIDRRVKERVDKELAEVREYAKELQRAQHAVVNEITVRALHSPTVGTKCPTCSLTLTREPRSRWLDCAACGDRISIEWSCRYSEEITRLRAALLEMARLSTAARDINASAAALATVAAVRKAPESLTE